MSIPLQPQRSDALTVQWFGGTSEALPASDEADAWFQDFLHVPCRLVFIPEMAQHPVAPGYTIDHNLAAFIIICLGKALWMILISTWQHLLPWNAFVRIWS